jgi:hypothetical protein
VFFLDTVAHHSIQLSEVIVPDILDSDLLPILCHILDSVKESQALNLVEKLRGWEWFPSLTFELIAPARVMHVAFKIPYVYNYITKVCKKVRSNRKLSKSKCTWNFTKRSHAQKVQES